MTGQCRADGLIDPDAIPGANIKPEQVDAAGTAFATAGTDVQTRGSEVKTAWAGLGGSYTTPDSAELLAVMDGVETDTAALAGTMQKVSTAISDYATVVAPIARRLVELKAEAETFVAKALQGKTVGPWDPEHPANQGPVGLVQHFGEILDDVHLRWDEYTPYVDENNELLTKVAEQETKLSQASTDCVNAINGLRTDMCIAEVQAVDYTAAVKANEAMPWGSTGRGDQSCQESFDSGVGDAAVGTVEGLGGLIGYNSQTGEWGDGEWAGQSWLGFAESLGALALMGSPPLILAATLPPGVLPDVVRETAQGITAKQQAIVEGFVGSPEDWRDDPAHAAGGAAFNIGTLFIPGAGEIGAGAKVAAVGSRVAAMAADGSRLAAFGSKVAAAGTTIVRVGDALSAIPGRALDGLGDLVSRGRGSFADALRGLGDNIPTVKVSVEHAMATPDGFGVGIGRPHIEVGHPEPGSHWLHSVADRVEGGGPGAHGGGHGDHVVESTAPPARDPHTAIGPEEQPVIGQVELQSEHATATWELMQRNKAGMAEQQYFTGIHQAGDGTVPELVIRTDDGRKVALDGFRVEDGQRVFTDTKGNYSFWYKFKNWTPEQLFAKDGAELDKVVASVNRQLQAIKAVGGGRLEYVVTDRRFGELLDDALQDRGLTVDVIIRSMP